MDNSTPHKSSEYDASVRKTIPGYERFFEETISLVKAYNPEPGRWLDTGCGTGTMIEYAAGVFPSAKFVLADPSEAMLDQARGKLKGMDPTRIEILPPAGSGELNAKDNEKYDIITAIQCHHYLNKEKRLDAVRACWAMLKDNGMLIVFENIRPFSETGIHLGLKRWGEFQETQGRSRETVEKHLQRFDHEYFPITVIEHLDLFLKAGFETPELFYFDYMQAGFFAIK